MAEVIHFFFAPEDEELFFEFLARYGLELYPEFVPSGWEPLPVARGVGAGLTETGWYLAAPRIGEVRLQPVKRGRHKGRWNIDETRSPVIHYERSFLDEDGVLRSGRLWAHLDIAGEVSRNAPPEAFRSMWLQIREHLSKICVRSRPVGWLVAPGAARAVRRGIALRDSDHKGARVEPYR